MVAERIPIPLTRFTFQKICNSLGKQCTRLHSIEAMIYYRLDHAEDLDKLVTYLLNKLPDMPNDSASQLDMTATSGTRLPPIDPKRVKENWRDLLPTNAE